MPDRRQLLLRLQELSFTLDDVQLYLDTHPRDAEALSFYRRVQALRGEAAREYEREAGPLTRETAADEEWSWGREAWPWEREA